MDNNLCKVLIPACGKSERFKEKTALPKGLVRFRYRNETMTMVEHVTRKLPDTWQKWVIYHVDEEKVFHRHVPGDFNLLGIVRSLGQADTIYQSLCTLGADEDFIVLNCDNAISLLDKSIAWIRSWHAACGVVVFEDLARSDRYGYIDAYPHFTKGAEKTALSQYALAGAFYFKNRAVYESAYRKATVGIAGQELYISSLFEHIGGVKIASWIDRRSLHEWGTWQQLQDDTSVTIDWSRQNE